MLPVEPSRTPDSSRDAEVGYALLRLAVGVNFTLHSFQRWKDIGKFADGVVRDFANTPLPEWSVRAFAWVIPFWEPAVGVLVVLGLFTRWALAAGAAFVVVLSFGTAMRGEFGALGSQLLYSLVFFALQFTIRHNRFSLDHALGRRTAR